jgi:hypothetical protein
MASNRKRHGLILLRVFDARIERLGSSPSLAYYRPKHRLIGLRYDYLITYPYVRQSEQGLRGRGTTYDY